LAKAAVLVHEAGGALREGLRVVGGPPVLQIAFCVELPALIVEAVSKLVADHRDDASEIDPRIGGGAVEGRPEGAGREVDVVLERMVVRIRDQSNEGVRAWSSAGVMR
jgi:hypothetical protein